MFTQLRPVLYVDDLPAEIDFYQRLGFQVAFRAADFAGLVFGEPILFGLQQRSGARFETTQPLIWQIAVGDIDAVSERCTQEHMTILQPPQLQDWGEWTMTVVSPNGYRVIFEGDKK